MTDSQDGPADEASAYGERSGAFDQDPVQDPDELLEVIEREDNAHRVLAAMRQFIRRDDTAALERAVAVYVRSARARGEPIEVVLGTLQAVADELERDAAPGFRQRDTPLRNVLLRGVLLAFYGAETVQREASARRARVERRKTPRSEAPAQDDSNGTVSGG